MPQVLIRKLYELERVFAVKHTARTRHLVKLYREYISRIAQLPEREINGHGLAQSLPLARRSLRQSQIFRRNAVKRYEQVHAEPLGHLITDRRRAVKHHGCKVLFMRRAQILYEVL